MNVIHLRFKGYRGRSSLDFRHRYNDIFFIVKLVNGIISYPELLQS